MFSPASFVQLDVAGVVVRFASAMCVVCGLGWRARGLGVCAACASVGPRARCP